MIRLEQLKIKIDPSVRKDPWEWEDTLRKHAARALKLSVGDIIDIRLLRHSIDARRKPELFDVCTAELKLSEGAERLVLKRGDPRVKKASFALRHETPPPGEQRLCGRPIVTGAGPAGLFAALTLARAGYAPILIERGDDTAERDRAVKTFLSGGALDTESNVQFGAGGAGAYSDGKLTTGIKDRDGILTLVMRTLVDMGAPDDILYETYPHVGTDGLKVIVENLINEIRSLGGEVRFRTRLDELVLDKAGAVAGVKTSAGDIRTNALILAAGHSARDTFLRLISQGVRAVPKAFAVGFRVAHPQYLIDRAQYGIESKSALPPAIYKLSGKSAGRAVYSFCMCPGGVIINASSERGHLAVNGMSERARDKSYANSAIVAAVSPEDYLVRGAVSDGIAFQQRLEERAFLAGGGAIPWSCYGALRRVLGLSTSGVSFLPDCEEIFSGPSKEADISGIMDREITLAIASAIESFGRRIGGFDDGGAVLAGIESRTSSPLRLERGEDGQSVNVGGLYPCGEGAGYAGGIVSAAADGVRTAEKLIRRFARPSGA